MNSEIDNRQIRTSNENGILLGGFTDIKSSVLRRLYQDEKLLRLLYYEPETSKRPPPLSDKLPDIVGSDKQYDIIDKRILSTEKNSELEDKSICRITVFFGKQRPQWNNNLVFNQDLYLNVFVHENYNDLRMEQIVDALDQIMVGSRFQGISKVEASGKEPFQGMRQYSQIRCRYKIMGIYGAR